MEVFVFTYQNKQLNRQFIQDLLKQKGQQVYCLYSEQQVWIEYTEGITLVHSVTPMNKALIKAIRYTEKQEILLFKDKTFYTFATKVNECLPTLALPLGWFQELYQRFLACLDVGIYAEIAAILETVRISKENILIKHKGDTKAVVDNQYELLNYIVSSYKSMTKQRFLTLLRQNTMYIKWQENLFFVKAKPMNFMRSYEIHCEVQQALEKKYEEMLCLGTRITTRDDIRQHIVKPILACLGEDNYEVKGNSV